ncbi:hypothetical protein KTN05_08455 [Paracoccus sp. Z118]|uniref:hypothetical protein n=1 Tax=Paracoccus sp. Z118 TaxID=2851017 RepID=UPI001C2C1F4A|nr:hypothetical protein [Paracoccus sp. Z118]MBV0891879.1 hypothetical protein [Paracoccus sp. Z118]
MQSSKFFGGIAAMLALSSCGPSTVNLPWRDGVSYAQVDAANTQCDVHALQQVPQAISTTTTPVHVTPPNIICNQIGNQTFCNDYGSHRSGGHTQTTDLNLDLRKRVKNQCLAHFGVQVISFQRCTSEQSKRAVAGRVLPPASQVECITENGYVLR